MSAIPPPHRFVGAHDPTSGAPLIVDEDVPLYPVPGLDGVQMGMVYNQSVLPHDPHKAEEGATSLPEGRIIDGAYIAILEVAPGKSLPTHYTNSLDFVVLTHGQLEYIDHENKKYTINAGTVIVHCAVAHGYSNTGPGPARMVCTVMRSKPFLLGGKSLQEAKGLYCMAA